MSTLQIIISGALALASSGLGIVCCYIFGCHLAPGEEGQLYGVLGGTADALKAVLPLGVAAALTSGQKARAAIGIVLFVVFSVYSFASELGLYALGRDAQSSGAAAGREQYQTLKGERALIKDRLAELGQTRPAKTVTSELAGQKQSRSWESSGICKDAGERRTGRSARRSRSWTVSLRNPGERPKLPGLRSTSTAHPGAYAHLSCDSVPEPEAIQTLMSLYAAHWEKTTQDQLTGGVSKLMRGPAIGAPDPKFWDCEVIPDGAEMFVSVIGPISRVSVRKPAIFGVTLQSMYTPLPGPKWPFELSGKISGCPNSKARLTSAVRLSSAPTTISSTLEPPCTMYGTLRGMAPR